MSKSKKILISIVSLTVFMGMGLALFGGQVSAVLSRYITIQPQTISSEGFVTNHLVPSYEGTLSTRERKVESNTEFLVDGFPVSVYRGAGSYQGGQFIDVTVNDVTGDGRADIFFSSLASGPLNGISYDGTTMDGFPIYGGGVAYTASTGLYLVAAFNGDCNPTCRSYVNLYNNKGVLMWSKPTLGIGVQTAPVMYEEKEQILIVYENSSQIHLVDIDGNSLPGWPINFHANASIAVADLANDGHKEIIVSQSALNGKSIIKVFNRDGSLHSVTPSFDIQVRTYPSIGDVNNDGELDIVAVGRIDSYPWHTKIYIFNHDGTLQNSFSVADTTSYGVQASLADIDNDSIPEILFICNNNTYVMDASGNHKPGWPKAHEQNSVYGTNSNIIVADVVSDGDRNNPEIIYTLRSGNGNSAVVKIYNHDGTKVERWNDTQVYPLASGRSIAIADINGDSYNEIVIASSDWTGVSGYYPELWAFNLNKNQRPIAHGPIEWGQYGNDSGKSSLYIKPEYTK